MVSHDDNLVYHTHVNRNIFWRLTEGFTDMVNRKWSFLTLKDNET